MSIIAKSMKFSDLTKVDYDQVISELREKIKGRVDKAYLFGSFANKTHRADSDIDIILIMETTTSFTSRSQQFVDLFDTYPKLDILVYTQREFDSILTQEIGFGKNIQLSLKNFYKNGWGGGTRTHDQ